MHAIQSKSHMGEDYTWYVNTEVNGHCLLPQRNLITTCYNFINGTDVLFMFPKI
jgi:hypothetical protein